MSKIQLEPVRGFRDLLPPFSHRLTRLMHIFEEIAQQHGYFEIKPPTLERFEIFALKSGEEIRRSMYVFHDKAGREVTLRPEATASIARIYLKHLRHLPKPIRIYYIINCFRYEEPQYARYREFWQAGIEIIGGRGLEYDFESIKLLVKFYEKIKMINHIKLKIGNTALYRNLFTKYKLQENIQDHILHLLDKKQYKEAVKTIEKHSLDPRLVEFLEKLWKNPKDLDKARELVDEYYPDLATHIEELVILRNNIKSYKQELSVEVDLSFARGLAYYTGIIYEVIIEDFPVSIAGGGRYDTLIELYGGERTPGTGFAIGLDRTLMAMEELGLSLPVDPITKIAIIVLKDAPLRYIAEIQDKVVENPHIVSTIFWYTRLPKILPQLQQQGYTYAIIVGGKEYQNRSASIRNLNTKEQVEVPLDEIQKHLTSRK